MHKCPAVQPLFNLLHIHQFYTSLHIMSSFMHKRCQKGRDAGRAFCALHTHKGGKERLYRYVSQYDREKRWGGWDIFWGRRFVERAARATHTFCTRKVDRGMCGCVCVLCGRPPLRAQPKKKKQGNEAETTWLFSFRLTLFALQYHLRFVFPAWATLPLASFTTYTATFHHKHAHIYLRR